MMRIVRTAAGILALFWMCVIFAFSAQEQEESSAVSESFSYRMVCSADSFLGLNWDDERLHEIADAIEGYVRKAVHMTEFGLNSQNGNENRYYLSVNRIIATISQDKVV